MDSRVSIHAESAAKTERHDAAEARVELAKLQLRAEVRKVRAQFEAQRSARAPSRLRPCWTRRSSLSSIRFMTSRATLPLRAQ